MQPYAETNIFTVEERILCRKAQNLVGFIPDADLRFRDLRCHELAIAVGTVLGLPVATGWFDHVEHSWLWSRKILALPSYGYRDYLVAGEEVNILDVYVPGALPQVQLVNYSAWMLPFKRCYILAHNPRSDIKEYVVRHLLDLWGFSSQLLSSAGL